MNLTDPSTLCLLILAITAALLLIRTRGRLARQRQRWATEERGGGDYDEPRERASSPASIPDDLARYADGPRLERRGRASSPENIPDDLARWEVEIHETARQLSAQLDAKLSLLRSLIAEADRAAARLEEALERTQPTLPPGSQAESLRPAAGRTRDMRHELESILAAPDPSADDNASPPASDRARSREEIYRLADYGFAAVEIARRVAVPVGEVELILSLRDSK